MRFFLISILLISGFAFCQTGSNNKTQSLLKEISKGNSTAKVDALNSLSNLYYRESTHLGTSYANKAYTLSKELKYTKGEAVALRNIGFGYYLVNKADSAVLAYSKAIQLLDLLHDINEKAACLNNLGLVYWRRGEAIKAFDYYRQAKNLAEKTNDSLEISKALNYIGLVYWKWGDLSYSLDYFTKALRIKELIEDEFETAVTLNNIANIYNELGEYSESLTYSNRALRISEKTNDKYGQGRALNNIGVSYFKQKNYEKAKEIQLKSITVKESQGDNSGLGYTYLNIGDIYFDLKNYNKAIEYYDKSLKIRNLLKDNYAISSVLIKLGKAYQNLNNMEEAFSHFNRSLEIARKEGIKENEKDNYLGFSSLYEKQGDYKRSLEYFKLYNELHDSIYKKENRDKLAELRINFESEKKEKEIALLTKENELRQLQINKQSQRYNILITLIVFGIFLTAAYFYFQNKRKLLLEEQNRNIEKYAKELQELNASKDKFFSIVAHDLKGPFHGLLGFSNLLADEFESLNKDQVRRYVNNIRSATKNVYGLVENLLDWSRIQIGRYEFAPGKIELKKEAEEVKTLLANNAAVKNIVISNKVDEAVFVTADVKMIHSVFQNLLSNAIKFTKASGEITFTAKEAGNFTEITVADNGIGISPENIERIFKIDTQFTTNGTAGEKGTGLGLLLCKEMIEKNGGTIKVESEVDKGSKFIFTLPTFING